MSVAGGLELTPQLLLHATDIALGTVVAVAIAEGAVSLLQG